MSWGPQEPQEPIRPPVSAPRRRSVGCGGTAAATVAALVLLSSLFGSLREGFNALVYGALGAALAYGLFKLAGVWRRRRAAKRTEALAERAAEARLDATLARDPDPLGAVRELSASCGGGAYIGLTSQGEWVSADPEHAVCVVGPPRSGKSSAVFIPALLAAPAPAVSTSTKRDVMDATLGARRAGGQVWHFDPMDAEPPPQGARRLRWSPLPAARSWDGALLMAEAMVAAARTGGEDHWNERASALLAPLLHAGALGGLSIADVHRWVLRRELDAAGQLLEQHEAGAANDVLIGIAKTHEREQSSIFSTLAGILSAYNADGPRRVAADPNFNPHAFVRSAADTIYITAPEDRQRLAAPLIVGLLQELRRATYAHTRALGGKRERPVLFALDECAKIAPIHDLPVIVSEAGGQGLQVMCGFQDLSQVRHKWGPELGEGILSLFGTKAILPGIADPKTLETLSLAFGEYDRVKASATAGESGSLGDSYTPGSLIADRAPSRTYSESFGYSESVTYTTERQRVLPPGDIANIPPGRMLYVRNLDWSLIETTPFYSRAPWPQLVACAAPEQWALAGDEAPALSEAR